LVQKFEGCHTDMVMTISLPSLIKQGKQVKRYLFICLLTYLLPINNLDLKLYFYEMFRR